MRPSHYINDEPNVCDPPSARTKQCAAHTQLENNANTASCDTTSFRGPVGRLLGIEHSDHGLEGAVAAGAWVTGGRLLAGRAVGVLAAGVAEHGDRGAVASSPAQRRGDLPHLQLARSHGVAGDATQHDAAQRAEGAALSQAFAQPEHVALDAKAELLQRTGVRPGGPLEKMSVRRKQNVD